MTPVLVVSIIAVYFSVLILISYFTSRGASSDTFFTANRQSPWYLVAYGMIGASLSGVTFVSVPGNVTKIGYGYMQVVMGYMAGYWIIIFLLLPLYYRLNVISIYTYLEQRFGRFSYKTGAAFFLLSRTLGSSLRLYLAAAVLQLFLFDAWHVPFIVTVAVTIVLIWIYTYRGGIKTIVWTDTFQTTFLVSAVVICVYIIASRLGLSFSSTIDLIAQSRYSRWFYWEDVNSTLYFPKQFIGGLFITVAMTGLDQDMMQKNLTCRSLGDAQKNMFWFSIILFVVNLLFVTLGALLYLYCEIRQIPVTGPGDELFPMMAQNEFGLVAGIFFLLGIIASSYASADSALAALTTSFCIDFLNFRDKQEAVKVKQKNWTHVGFSLLFLLIIVVFREINQRSLIDAVLNVAGYTCGPLLGLFSFGIFTRRQVRDRWVPLICIVSPAISYGISYAAPLLLDGYQIGLEILLINGLVTYAGLLFISIREVARPQ
ncbi:MAG: sodium:solute symporter [Cyclobacteriaceae bacterium]|nr:sodium:solute symporter [Cyclobacteriaceae bacterium]